MLLGFATLIASYVSVMIQLVLYVWCTEDAAVKTVTAVFSIITSLPLFSLLPCKPGSASALSDSEEGPESTSIHICDSGIASPVNVFPGPNYMATLE